MELQGGQVRARITLVVNWMEASYSSELDHTQDSLSMSLQRKLLLATHTPYISHSHELQFPPLSNKDQEISLWLILLLNDYNCCKAPGFETNDSTHS